MIVVLPFCTKDSDQALRLLDWIGQLGGAAAYHCLLVADAGVSWGVGLEAVQLASKAFRSVTIITNDEPVDGWIPGGNSLFFTAMEYIEKEHLGPWLLLEPDAVPLKPHWLDQIFLNYTACGKPFMGMIYKCDTPSLPRENLSGVAVYPKDAWTRLQNWRDTTLNWDVAIAYVTVPNAEHTDLIYHYWGEPGKPPTFGGSSPPQIPPSAVLFHRCKDNTLIRILKNKFSGFRVDMQGVTLWAIAWGHLDSVRRIKRVLRYCQSLFQFGETILFSTVPETNYSWKTVAVECRNFSDFNRLTNRLVPAHLKTDFAMSVQEDGFPIRPDLWSDDFMAWDYIGAPWADGVVGNGGFYIESKKMIQARIKLPDNPATKPPMGNVDWWLCRTNRSLLESQGVRFAPTEMAERFSTELTRHNKPSFGFHGRIYNPEKYKEGWDAIRASEQ